VAELHLVFTFSTPLGCCSACFILGAFFLVLGGAGAYATKMKHWGLMSLVFLVGIALSIGLMCISMSALMMATGNMDPVAEVLDKAWNDPNIPFRKELETTNVEGEVESYVYCRDRTPSDGRCAVPAAQPI